MRPELDVRQPLPAYFMENRHYGSNVTDDTGGQHDWESRGLEKEPDVGVTDAVADDLRVDAGLQRTGGVRMPEVVEGDAGTGSI
jgi:hypothetical protein